MKESLLMSIKTQYINQIFAGTKKYEFRRKSIGKNNCNKKIYIYSSKEDKAIVGYIIIDKILSEDLKTIQELTNNLNNKSMENYFKDLKICYALHIKEYHKFIEPIKLIDIKIIDKNFVIPQFYRYIKQEEPIYNILKNKK